MSQIGFPEILIILVLIVVLFGAKRLPDAARSLGRSMRIFKSEVKEMTDDEAGEKNRQQAIDPSPATTQHPGYPSQPGYQAPAPQVRPHTPPAGGTETPHEGR